MIDPPGTNRESFSEGITTIEDTGYCGLVQSNYTVPDPHLADAEVISLRRSLRVRQIKIESPFLSYLPCKYDNSPFSAYATSRVRNYHLRGPFPFLSMASW